MPVGADAHGQALKRRIKTLVQAAVPGFRLLLSGQEAFSARAEAIAQATDTIDLQYYITHDGIRPMKAPRTTAAPCWPSPGVVLFTLVSAGLGS